METETPFNEKQSLEVIRDMINSSKQNLSENAAHFLIWGWAILVAAVIQYAVLLMQSDFRTEYTWFAAILIAGFAAGYTGYKQDKKKQSKTYVDRMMTAVWGGSGGMFTILAMTGFVFDWVFIYPAIIAVYSWGVLISGALLKFKPMIVAGTTGFFIAGITVYMTNIHIVLMLILSLIIVYLIPAYMLKNLKR